MKGDWCFDQVTVFHKLLSDVFGGKGRNGLSSLETKLQAIAVCKIWVSIFGEKMGLYLFSLFYFLRSLNTSHTAKTEDVFKDSCSVL